MQHPILHASFVLLVLLAAGISIAEVDDTGTDGKTITIADPAVTQTSDGLTGSGNLTLTTTGYTAGTAASYGTYQFNSGATTSGFTGGLVLNGASVDLNGTSLAVTGISTVSNDKTASVTNSSATAATLTLSKPIKLYAQISGNLNVAWTISGTANLCTPMTHTGGTTLSGGSEIYVQTGVTTTNPFGSGKTTLNGVKTNWNANAYTQSAPLELIGDNYFRMSSSGSLNISGEISGSGNLIVPYDGANFTISGSTKTYTGKTVIGSTTYCWGDARAKAQITLGAANVLPSGTTVEMGGDYGGSTLALNGYAQTIKALKGTGTISSATAKNSTLTVSSSDVSGNFTLGVGATLALPAGTYTNLSTSGDGTLSFSGDATISSPARWGVTKIDGASNYSVAANPTEWTLTPTKLSTNSSSEFPNNTTYSYSGYFLVTEETSLSFLKNFDDTGCVWVTPVSEDGTLGTRVTAVASGTGSVGTKIYTGSDGDWDDVVVGQYTLSAGKWLIEARVGQGGGGVGPTYKYTDGSGKEVLVPGIGVKAGANTDLAGVSAYKVLNITEDSLALAGISTVLAASANQTLSSKVQIAKDATLTLDAGTNAIFKVSGNISGDGGKLVLAGQKSSEAKLLGTNTYSGGTTVQVPKLTLNSASTLGSGTVTFDSADGTEVVFNPAEGLHTALWKEGTIVKSDMQTAEIPSSYTYTAEATYTSKSPGDSTTRTYISDELVSDQNFTMYFGKMYDDAAYLKITDLTDGSKTSVVLNNGTWNAAAFGTYDFLEGHHYTIDLRVYNGGGGAGPVTGTNNSSGMPDGIGFGASLQGFTDGTDKKGNDSFVLMNFDSTGALIGSALRGFISTTFTQDFVLNSDVSIDASNGTLQFDGKISGDGALTLKNGKFTLTHAGNSVGGLTLENASFGASKTTGVIQVTGDLNLKNTAISLDLTGLESDASWTLFNVADGGDVEMTNTNWTVSLDGDPTTTVTALKLVNAEDLPGDFWKDASLTFTNPELRGQFAVDENGAYLVFGNATSLPEPATWVLLLLGAVGFGSIKFRRK